MPSHEVQVIYPNSHTYREYDSEVFNIDRKMRSPSTLSNWGTTPILACVCTCVHVGVGVQERGRQGDAISWIFIWMRVPMETRGQTSGIVSQEPFILLFETRSHQPRAHQIG